MPRYDVRDLRRSDRQPRAPKQSEARSAPFTWIKTGWVTTTDNPPQHLEIEEAGDVLDDVVGPMVTRLVNVSIIRRGKKLVYQDTELEE
jgi:hypothetical protein